mmetsp:Transcript_24600/g.69936  ORF Transcript_24600/g.69936 Transcript_24600/m.69936 type:complete len:308 (+) Transcript_24600:822-1745(+)
MQALLEGLRQRGIPRLGPVLACGLAGGPDECRVLGRRVPHICCWAVARSGHLSFCSGRLPVDADHMLPSTKWDPDGRQRPRRESVGRRGAGQSFNFCACRAAIGPDLDVLSYCGVAGIHAWLGLDFHPRREGFELVEDVGLPHVGLQQFGRRLGVLQRRAVCLWPAEHQWHMGDPRLRLHRLSLGHYLCLRLRLGCGRLDARALHRQALPHRALHLCHLAHRLARRGRTRDRTRAPDLGVRRGTADVGGGTGRRHVRVCTLRRGVEAPRRPCLKLSMRARCWRASCVPSDGGCKRNAARTTIGFSWN